MNFLTGQRITADLLNSSLVDIGNTPITADTTGTSGTTESGALASVVGNLISGEQYWVELIGNINCDNATAVPIGARIREDTAAGSQVAFEQIYFASTASTGFAIYVSGLYTASATGSKTFVVTLQRNGGATGVYKIAGGAGRASYLRIQKNNTPP